MEEVHTDAKGAQVHSIAFCKSQQREDEDCIAQRRAAVKTVPVGGGGVCAMGNMFCDSILGVYDSMY